MRNVLHMLVAALIAALVFTSPARAEDCPTAVKAGIDKSFPGAKCTGCKKEEEGGKTQYECKIETKDGKKLELDVSPEGKILMIEEGVDLKTVPEAVLKAFKAKYPHGEAKKANKQTHPSEDGKGAATTTYEIAFQDGKDKKEATFKDDGTFESEE